MRIHFLVITLLALFITFPALTHAEYPEDYPRMMKFKRGITNVVTSPLEIPHNIKTYWKKDVTKKPARIKNALVGTGRGLFRMVGRLGAGLWDTLTFNVEYPKNFKPLIQPEYICESGKKKGATTK